MKKTNIIILSFWALFIVAAISILALMFTEIPFKVTPHIDYTQNAGVSAYPLPQFKHLVVRKSNYASEKHVEIRLRNSVSGELNVCSWDNCRNRLPSNYIPVLDSTQCSSGSLLLCPARIANALTHTLVGDTLYLTFNLNMSDQMYNDFAEAIKQKNDIHEEKSILTGGWYLLHDTGLKSIDEDAWFSCIRYNDFSQDSLTISGYSAMDFSNVAIGKLDIAGVRQRKAFTLQHSHIGYLYHTNSNDMSPVEDKSRIDTLHYVGNNLYGLNLPIGVPTVVIWDNK
ncbi:MAG: hypothetical protein II222_02770 [Paraprevotella sp.]|nr:hypothetical protein [Paraprevotella sp.]